MRSAAPVVDVGVRERLLVLRNGRSEERRIPFEGLLLERNLVDPGHESESIWGALRALARRRRARRRPRPCRHLRGRGRATTRRARARDPDGRQSLSATPSASTSASAPTRGRSRREIRIQNAASPSSIVIPTRIARIPSPRGRTNTARKRAMTSAIALVDDQDRRPELHVVEQPGRVGDVHTDAAVRGGVADRCRVRRPVDADARRREPHPARAERVPGAGRNRLQPLRPGRVGWAPPGFICMSTIRNVPVGVGYCARPVATRKLRTGLLAAEQLQAVGAAVDDDDRPEPALRLRDGFSVSITTGSSGLIRVRSIRTIPRTIVWRRTVRPHCESAIFGWPSTRPTTTAFSAGIPKRWSSEATYSLHRVPVRRRR